MFPPNLRDARASTGIARELPSPAEGSALLAEEHISYQQSKVQDHRIADRSTPSAVPTIGEDPGALLIGVVVEFRGRIGSCDSFGLRVSDRNDRRMPLDRTPCEWHRHRQGNGRECDDRGSL